LKSVPEEIIDLSEDSPAGSPVTPAPLDGLAPVEGPGEESAPAEESPPVTGGKLADPVEIGPADVDVPARQPPTSDMPPPLVPSSSQVPPCHFATSD
jgi:hypothetical protein